ncbi:WD repeat-containing protein on Y chromosome [Culicoides brevitarsis]|uniref:WD repeat-containing protein on Y chromosome n=1 Tax=Culicoides brevitarsis TaxID=469753 RepID=UPI00307BA7BD
MSSFSGSTGNKSSYDVVYGSKFSPRYSKSPSKSSKKSSKVAVNRSTTGSTTRMSFFGTEKSDAKTPQLHKRLTKENIEKLFLHFRENDETNKKMDRCELRDTFEKFNIYYTDDEFENLFLKINTDRDNLVDWNEVVSYMLIGFEDDFGDKANESLDPPIKEKPVVRRTQQRHHIVRIDFLPTVLPGQSVNMKQGIFVSIALDGAVNFYDLDWELQRVGKSPSPTLKWARTQVTDGICLPDVRIICIASTERDLRFYETTANSYSLKLQITQLPEVVNTLHYYFNVKDPNSRLTLGDNKGSVRVLTFASEGRGPFKNLGVRRSIKAFKANEGVSCFCYDEASNIIATGGPDFIVRLWSPFTPQKPFCVFSGHNSGISFIFLQDNAKKCYSMDNAKIIKVWDVEGQFLLQTYIYLMQCFPDRGKLHIPMKAYYSDIKRQMVVASGNFAVMSCCPLLRLDLTDGNTHTKPVSIVLYNRLFDVIITCGFDSFIIVWDSNTGSRLNLIKMAHSRILHGENMRVEITAACFDPKDQLLLTGANDGTLKVWNFNNGFCVRHMSISSGAEVTAVFWVTDRILAVGWDRRVTEFAEVGIETEYPLGKQWDIQHSDDILCAAISCHKVLVTASYNGDIVFWRSETGQPFKKFNIEEPTTSIRIQYGGMKKVETEQREEKSELYKMTHRLSYLPQYMKIQQQGSLLSGLGMKHRKISVITLPTLASQVRQMSVQAMVFLESRPFEPNYGTLLTSLDNGKVLVWNHTKFGGYLKQFNAIHMAGDSVSYMSTGENDTYLFTGTVRGYIKTWLLTNYCVPSESHVHISMPQLRLQFPFLIKTAFLGRAKRSAKTQKLPMLVNSYKAHTKPIMNITYIERRKILLTSSSDCSVRLWTLGGQYLGTLGSPIPIAEVKTGSFFHKNFRIPPDIKREASFTTLQVLTDGETHPVFRKAIELVEETEDTPEQKERRRCIYGKSLKEPILGKHFSLPKAPSVQSAPQIDTSLPHIPIYAHLNVS